MLDFVECAIDSAVPHDFETRDVGLAGTRKLVMLRSIKLEAAESYSMVSAGIEVASIPNSWRQFRPFFVVLDI